MRRCTGRGRRCTRRRNLTGRSLVSGFVDAPGRRDDIVAYADNDLRRMPGPNSIRGQPPLLPYRTNGSTRRSSPSMKRLSITAPSVALTTHHMTFRITPALVSVGCNLCHE